MMRIKTLYIFVLLLIGNLISQDFSISKIEPPNWWVGMKWNRLQLMIYGNELQQLEAGFDDESIEITKIYELPNTTYAFIDVMIPLDLKPGDYMLTLSNPKEKVTIEFPVLRRDNSKNIHQGFSTDDIIYLITPDRFANGDPDNDRISGMRDNWSPTDKIGRHGGDIQGIYEKLDYLEDLGVTAIWINPLVENNMGISYHGYAATDFYRIDPRFGTNDLYKDLVEGAHDLDIKIIMDHVSNHIGIYHPWMDNLPMEDWLNGTKENHQNNMHGKTTLNDLYADSMIINNVQNGWFADEMPDLNQKNPFLANYIIQNTIWWIEYTGLDGIREDTYPYADLRFLSNWAEAIINEYPNFNIVGEIWIHDPVFLSTYQAGSFFPKRIDSHLPSVTDFGLFEAFGRVFNRNQSIGEVHKFLSRDFIYPDPNNLVTFLDNHDVMRTIDLVNGNIQRFKMALQILLTTRGIPQIYYGTEIGLRGGKDHGEIRRNFPGGFPEDSLNAFEEEGRTDQENDLWQFLKNIIALRKSHKALSKGKLTHYKVFDELYLYFRSFEDEKIMIIANNNGEKRDIELKFFERKYSSGDIFTNLKTGEIIKFSGDKKLVIPAYDLGIYKIIKADN